MIVEAAIPRHITGIYIFAVVNLMAMLCLSGVDADIIVTDTDSNDTAANYPDLPAKFGPDFPKDGLQGRVVAADPPEACTPIKPPPPVPTTYPWIVVIARGGNCQFSDKVLAAELNGYAAAIVYNYMGNESLIPMSSGSNGSHVHIPSTFVGYTSGITLKSTYNYKWNFIIKIIDDDDELKLYLWPFAIVVGVCFLIFIIFVIIKFVRDHASRRLNRLSKKHLKKIPVRKFKKGDYYDTCAICLDEYEEGEKIRVLPCDHVYHMKCIDPWLTKNKKTCPVCKRRVIPGRDADSDSGSDSDEGGSASRTGSESTPLLRGEGPLYPRSQSHGSINIVGNDNPSSSTAPQGRENVSTEGIGSAVLTTLDEYGAVVPSDNEAEPGAVGGVGISDRHHGRQVQSVRTAISSQGSIQGAGEERREAHAGRKRKRHERDRRTRRVQEQAGEEETENATAPLVSESREERRERRRRKKEKKRVERTAKDEEGASSQAAQGGAERRVETEVREDVMENRSPSTAERVEEAAGKSSALKEGEDQPTGKNDEERHESYINPSYSESQEVTVPHSGRRHEMNELV